MNRHMTSATPPTTVADELAAIRRIANTLETLDADARTRVLNWLNGRYNSADTDTEEGRG